MSKPGYNTDSGTLNKQSPAVNVTDTGNAALLAPVNFTPRMTEPTMQDAGWKYYTRTDLGGYNTVSSSDVKPDASVEKPGVGCSALYNCVSYAWGRFNEIAGQGWKYHLRGNGGGIWWNNGYDGYWDSAKTIKIQTGNVPQVGALLIWRNADEPSATLQKQAKEISKGTRKSYDYTRITGHVAVVEKVDTKKNQVTFSESGYNWDKRWRTYTKRITEMTYSTKQFMGYIYNPAIPLSSNVTVYDVNPADAIGAMDVQTALNPLGIGGTNITSAASRDFNAILKANRTRKIEETNAQTLAEYSTINVAEYKGLDLLSNQTFVEAPFIKLDIGGYTFGTYTKSATGYIDYPNFVTGLDIVKVNGAFNQYTIQMTYQIQPGDDPNFIDKILGKVGYGNITLSYGDCESPSFIYRNEEALITKAVSRIDFSSQKIDYTINAISTAFRASALKYNFPSVTERPSVVLRNFITNKSYGILDAFPGMKLKNVNLNNWLPDDDKSVKLNSQYMDIVSYVNFLVGSMTANTNSSSETINDSTYHMVIADDIFNEFGGSYFKVVKVSRNTQVKVDGSIYDLDIGFPSNTLVVDFAISEDNSYAILNNYADGIYKNNYVYSINDDGQTVTNKVNYLQLDATQNTVHPIEKSWWTAMTSYPIKATLTLKGLLRPAILMNYIKVHTYFYGQPHNSSGLYIITKQEDRVDASGYRTTLSLTRISGDTDAQTFVGNTTAAQEISTANSDAAVNTKFYLKGTGGGSGGHNLDIAR